MSNDKEVRLNRAIQDVRDATGKSFDEVANQIKNDPVTATLFTLLYDQIDRFRTATVSAETEAAALRQRADLSAMKAQTYFVRLRDAGLLTPEEKF